MSFEQLESRITPLAQYGNAKKTSFPKVIPYDGSPLNLFFAKYNVPLDKVRQVLNDSNVGNALNIPKGTPIIIDY